MTDQYYTQKPTSKLRIQEIDARLRENNLKFYTGSGVFSIKQIDKGTKLLIDRCIIKEDWSVLDLGCGYGPVGIAIKKEYPKTSITLTDINQRALKLK